MAALEQTAMTGLGLLAVSLIGNYLISMRRGAEVIDAEQRGRIAESERTVAQLTERRLVKFDFHIEEDASTVVPMQMMDAGGSFPGNLSVRNVFLNVANKGQEPLEVVGYRIGRSVSDLASFPTNITVMPLDQGKRHITRDLISAIVGRAMPEYRNVCGLHSLCVAIDCKGDHDDAVISGEIKTFDLEVGGQGSWIDIRISPHPSARQPAP